MTGISSVITALLSVFLVAILYKLYQTYQTPASSPAHAHVPHNSQSAHSVFSVTTHTTDIDMFPVNRKPSIGRFIILFLPGFLDYSYVSREKYIIIKNNSSLYHISRKGATKKQILVQNMFMKYWSTL